MTHVVCEIHPDPSKIAIRKIRVRVKEICYLNKNSKNFYLNKNKLIE